MTQNNDRLLVFRNNGVDDDDGAGFVAVRLAGRPGNPTGVGALVTAVDESGWKQTAEVYAGSGYLSQSSSTLFFGTGGGLREIRVRWPDGRTSVHPVDDAGGSMTLRQPG